MIHPKKPQKPKPTEENLLLLEILEGILTHSLMDNKERDRCFAKLDTLWTDYRKSR